MTRRAPEGPLCATHRLAFVYSQGSSYAIGDCQRAPNGDLSNCKTYPVESD